MTEEDTETAAGRRTLAGRRVLIVEDEALIGLDVSLAVEAEGASAVVAHDLDAAHAALDDAPVDAAVLDINLGGGVTSEPIARRLRSANVPFIIHSGDFRMEGELIDEIGAPVIVKPAAIPVLIQAILDVLED